MDAISIRYTSCQSNGRHPSAPNHHLQYQIAFGQPLKGQFCLPRTPSYTKTTALCAPSVAYYSFSQRSCKRVYQIVIIVSMKISKENFFIVNSMRNSPGRVAVKHLYFAVLPRQTGLISNELTILRRQLKTSTNLLA